LAEDELGAAEEVELQGAEYAAEEDDAALEGAEYAAEDELEVGAT